jgi:aspartokinase
MTAQDSLELNMSFAVKEKDGIAAVQVIHEEFKLANIIQLYYQRF